MSVPEEVRRKLELYSCGHGGRFDIGSTENGVQVAVKFHPHTFSLAYMFAEDVFRRSGINVELVPSLLDRIVEPDSEQVVRLFYDELKRFAENQGGRFICVRQVGKQISSSPMKIYADFADEQLAVDWLEEMITMLFVPAVAMRWSRLNDAARNRILESAAVLGK